MNKLIYFLIAVFILILLGFQNQKDEKFYYSFNKRIMLSEVDTKLVIRFSEGEKRTTSSSSLTELFSGAKQDWLDERTVVIESESNSKRDKMMLDLRNSSKVIVMHPIYKIKTGLEMAMTDEFVVRFKKGIQKDSQNKLHISHGVSIEKITDAYQLLKVSQGMDVLETANAYQQSGLVEYSHPNFHARAEKYQQVIPNDTYFINQFTLHNTGQVFNDGHSGVLDADIDAPESWVMTKGSSSIIVAVLDDGVTNNHPDLPSDRQIRLNGSNFVTGNDPNNPSPGDNSDLSHGNAVAGVIAATQNNNEGISGICPNCKVMPIKIFNSLKVIVSIEKLAAAITFAKDNGAQVISNSWGFNSDDPNLFPVIVTAIQEATSQGRGGLGSVVIFAASNSASHIQGNNGFVSFPGNVNIPGVITVGASSRYDLQSDYSPSGSPSSTNNQLIDIVAPSHRAYPSKIAGETLEAWALDIPNNRGYNPWPEDFYKPGQPYYFSPPAVFEVLPNSGTNNLAYTGRFGGTSHSSAVVSGVPALMLSANPNLTQQQVFDIITSKADKVGGYNYANGRSNELGFGRVNACRTVLEAFRFGNSIMDNTYGLVCSNTTFTLQNSPSSSVVTWTSDPSALSINNVGMATRQNNYDGLVNVTSWINTGCGSSSVGRTVWVGRPVSSVSGSGYAYPGQLYTYNAISPNINGAFNYNWVVVGGTIYGGGGPSDTSVTIFWNESGYIELTSENLCGVSTGRLDVTVDIGAGCNPCQIAQMYPNPSSTELNITLRKETNTNKGLNTIISSGISLVNNSQNVVYSSTTKSLEIKIPTSGLPDGLYVLKVTNINGTETRQILIKH